jgi:hypothetical protein
MTDVEQLRRETRSIVERVSPSIDVLRIDAEEMVDSAGDISLQVTVLVKQRPSHTARFVSNVVDQLRSWLVSKRDDRFPYVNLITESEERELQRVDE